MTGFSCESIVNAPVEQVWKALADIGGICEWNPGVIRSHVTSEQASGIGARRHCDLGGRTYLDEDVIEWDPLKTLTMRIIKTNLPFESAVIRFQLRPVQNGTVVTVSPDYALRFGLLGRVLDGLYVGRVYRRGMKALLAGLKAHVEGSVSSISGDP